MKTSFKISDISDHTLLGRSYGKEVRIKIISLAYESEKIQIDFENKVSMSPSFIEEAFVKLVTDLGKEEFKRKIDFINLNQGLKSLMNQMLSSQLKRVSG